MKKIGLIAGNRKFPLLFSAAAKEAGYYVVVAAIKGDTSRRIKSCADKVYWLGLSELKRMFGIFKSEGITELVMAGQISPHRLFSREVAESPEIKRILNSIRDKKADTIFGAIADMLKEAGFELLDSTSLVRELIPEKGPLAKVELSPAGWEDVSFGLGLAREIAALDIGQTVAVKDKAVVGIEALEGTDKLILRSGRLARGGITVVKVSKPKQDLRFDVPVVGLNTVKNLVRVRARCLALEAGKAIFIDRQASVKLAEKSGLAIVAV